MQKIFKWFIRKETEQKNSQPITDYNQTIWPGFESKPKLINPISNLTSS